MAKLTLSVDDGVVLRAKRYAKQRGLSISKMVEAYLDAATAPAQSVARDAPILRSLRGSLKKADVEAYRRHVGVKYR
jgi:hypothetical protein